MQPIGMPATNPARSGSSGHGLGRYAIWVLTVVVLAGLGYFVYTYLHPAQPATPPVSTLPVRTDSIVAAVHGTGQIAPWNQAKLGFQISGTIISRPVHVGDTVKKGQVVATIEPLQYQIQLDQAKANLATAQAKLEQIQDGARPEDVAAAQAMRDAAQAKLDGMLAGGRPEDVKAAEAALASDQAHLDSVAKGAQPADVAAARAAVQQAEATLSKDQTTLADLTRPVDPLVVQQAQLAVDQAKSLLWKDQSARDAVCGNKAIPQATCNTYNAQLGADETAIQQAQTKLQQAQEGPNSDDIAAAKAAIASAQVQVDSLKAKLAQLQAGGLPDDIAQAKETVNQAEQTLQLKQHPYTDSDIAQQKQAVAQADAQLALRKAPYTKADLDAAQAAVDQAKAQVDLAQFNLGLTTLTAPFDGVVSSVNANVGELFNPLGGGTVVTIVDPNDLRLDVTVDETDVAQVQVGQPASVTFDALPGKTFDGKIVSIAPNAVVESGVATYTVSMDLQNAAGVRPGMTGQADIVYARRDNVVVVPNRVVRVEGDRKVVGILQGKTIIPTVVTTGVSDGSNTEITSGLQPGALVVVPLTAPSLPIAPKPAPATK